MKAKYLLVILFLFNCQVLLAQTMYVNSGNGVNLREGPGTNHKTMTTIPGGGKVNIVSNDGEWMKVKYDGKTGYIKSEYLTEAKPKTDNDTRRNDSRDNNQNASQRKSNSGTSSKSVSSYSANDRNWGLGIRLGDPLGVTAKKYLANGNALEFNVGRTSSWGYDYRDYFYDNEKYSTYDYLGYRRNNAIAFQVHYLFQKDIPGAKNLQWYWGVGGQARLKSHFYNYRYRAYYGPGGGDYVWVYAEDKVTDLDFGADVILGLEYHFPKAPLSMFVDVNLLVELFDDPLDLYTQGGVGLRYNF